MEYITGSSASREIDSYTITQTGIPSLVLMERASLAVCERAQKAADRAGGRASSICCVCGSGNNGGDGMAAARILYSRGFHACICFAGSREKLSHDAAIQLRIAEKIGVPVYTAHDFTNDAVIIDALFGTGLSRDITGHYAGMIAAINKAHSGGSTVIAVDIASGVNTDNGRIMGCAVQADETVTFGYRKAGMIFYPGCLCCGQVTAAEIGFDPNAVNHVDIPYYTYNNDDLDKLPVRREDSNKGTYGRVLVIAGSRNMAGAACFSAAAAYAAGCGLVTVFTPECNREIIQIRVPEAVLQTYDENEADFSRTRLPQLLKRSSAVIIGPGLGMSETAEKLVRFTMTVCEKPMIIDADALNIIAKDLSILKNAHAPAAITPHKMELSRLTGYNIQYLNENLNDICENFIHEYGVICIAKDARTMIFTGSGSVYINTSGCSGMSVGGSGDVLTGMIGGLKAQGLGLRTASELGVFLHGKAGESAAMRKTSYAMTASDIIQSIPAALTGI